MAIKSKSNVRIALDKLSYAFGKMQICEVGKPFTNDKTKETTTKVKVLSRYKGVTEMYEVTLPGELKEDMVKLDVPVDFLNAEIICQSSGEDSFNRIATRIDVAARAEKIEYLDKQPEAKK